MDACIPELPNLLENENPEVGNVGLTKHEGILGDP